jgi:hypothetical protein
MFVSFGCLSSGYLGWPGADENVPGMQKAHSSTVGTPNKDKFTKKVLHTVNIEQNIDWIRSHFALNPRCLLRRKNLFIKARYMLDRLYLDLFQQVFSCIPDPVEYVPAEQRLQYSATVNPAVRQWRNLAYCLDRLCSIWWEWTTHAY